MTCEKVAQILARLDQTTSDRLLAHLEKKESALARAVRNEMVRFEDLGRLDDRGLQTLLRATPEEELSTALHGAPEPLINRFANNLSNHGAEALREALAFSGPVTRHQVDTARRNMIATARDLEARGRLMLPGQAAVLY
ncbi:MAG: hypothetical protein HQL91_04255 [Magnetococcales bacterium]|nr:hypothetical protein [Magnetococcales bacterium]